MTDRYTKIVLTVIAAALVWMGVRDFIPNAHAQREQLQAVHIATVSTGAAKCIAGHGTLTRGNTGVCIHDGN